MAQVSKCVSALIALQQSLDTSGHITVIQEDGYRWSAKCSFEPPVDQIALKSVSASLPVSLPQSYAQFLLYCNGATLYHDDVYGQWGFRLYGTNDLVEANIRWRARYGQDWPITYIACAESLGDSDLLALDIARLSRNEDDCAVIDGDSGYQPEEWSIASNTFNSWVEHLVIAQGTKYWRWR